MEERPDFVTDEHLDYLDELRASAVTNMFGAAPYVQAAFGLTLKDARAVLTYWTRTFGERHADDAADLQNTQDDVRYDGCP